jgi:16S rRNA processing protein RimM
MEDERLLTIGKISKPHGVKGEVKIQLLTREPEIFDELEVIYITKTPEPENLKEAVIESSRFYKGTAILKLDIFNTPEEVDKYRGYYIQAEELELPPLEEDEYYFADILGTSVYVTTGEYIGDISFIIESGETDIYEITHPETGKVNMVPARKEFIKSLDVENKKMIVEPIEGLIEV